MSVKDAVVKRFREIMAQRNMRPNELANLSGVTPSTVYSMLDERRKELSINVIKKLCDGLDMTLGEFSARRYLTSWNRRSNNKTKVSDEEYQNRIAMSRRRCFHSSQ